MIETKLRRGTFLHVESELGAYHDTKREVMRIRDEIMNPYKFTDTMMVRGKVEEVNVVRGKNSVRKISDPTGQTATALVTNRKLEELERIINAIESVVERLPEEKKRLVKLRYWTKPQTLTWDGIALQLHVSKRQAMRWRDDIVFAIARELGWR